MHAVKYCFILQKFYLGLGGVDIHIQSVGRQVQVQHAGGKLAYHDLIAVGFFQSCHQQSGLHRTIVDEEGLHGAAGPGIGGLTDKAGEGVLLPAAFYPDHLGTFPAVDAVGSSL